ncbi:MAG: alpha/beta fold hydrolase [Bacteroidota bacterium]|nr:alpha/beta fold hydrolase [Bacteroidota bacterium]
MEILNSRKWLFLIVVFTGLFLNSCKDNNEPETPDYEYYISNQYKSEVTAQTINIKLLFAQVQFPEIAAFSAKATNDVLIHKVTYRTSLQGKNIKASGLVYLPKTAGNYPVLSFQNGTNTVNKDAPSESPGSDNWFMLESLASMGFIVVVPDYIGFGESANLPHPYLHAESTTQSILDMLRAVNELTAEDKVEAKPTKDLFIFGYSQGGWATMQLQREIEKNHSEEFDLVASSCAAGPYSIGFMNDFIAKSAEYDMPYFLGYLLNSYHSLELFPNKLNELFQEPYATKIPTLYNGINTGGTINTALTTNMTNLLTSEFRTGFDTNTKFAGLKSAFIANSVAPWAISTPTRLYHGSADELIPISLSNKMVQDLRTAGTPNEKIEMMTIPGANHSGGVFPVGISTIEWFLSLKK